MAEIEKKTRRHPTDLTDQEEWARIGPFLPGVAKSGRPAVRKCWPWLKHLFADSACDPLQKPAK